MILTVPSILSMQLIKEQAMPTFQMQYVQECTHTTHLHTYITYFLNSQEESSSSNSKCTLKVQEFALLSCGRQTGRCLNFVKKCINLSRFLNHTSRHFLFFFFFFFFWPVSSTDNTCQYICVAILSSFTAFFLFFFKLNIFIYLFIFLIFFFFNLFFYFLY